MSETEEFNRIIATRLPLACACLGPEPGETLCHCDKVRADLRKELASATKTNPEFNKAMRKAR